MKLGAERENYKISVLGVDVEVVHKQLKRLNIRVYPPDGKVCVAAPLKMKMGTIRQAILDNMGWIQKHQHRLTTSLQKLSYEYINDEYHYLWGRPYRLEIIPHSGSSTVVHQNNVIKLLVPLGSSKEERQKLLYEWYRTNLKEKVPGLLNKWEGIIGVQIVEWKIKRMKTKWGTCNPAASRIWLNLELAKKTNQCLEYIIVHELVHLLECHHNARFYRLLDQFMPSWKQFKDELGTI